MISKELLSEVLEYKDIPYHVKFDFKNGEYEYIMVSWGEESEYDMMHMCEVVKSCKEWALRQRNEHGLLIASKLGVNAEAHLGEVQYYWCVLLMNRNRVSPEFKGNTEAECVFKMGEWILEKKTSQRYHFEY